ncbi:MAG TPA: permease-like cell division protein FtsX [Streptosporangiaceae bacterium]|nr:permease-like cell division protein FtsX [Streptosporangiaceae bacterium]
MRSNFVFQEIWIGLRRNLTMTVVLVVVVAISLFLLGMGLLIMKQVNNTKTFWQGKVEISVYLCTSTSPSLACRQNGPATAQERAQIMHDLQALPQVEHVYYESQQLAYQRFKQEFSNQPSFVQAVPADEIPDSFRVKLRNPATDYSIVAGTLQGRPGVDQIMDERSLLDKFYKLLNGLRNGSLIVALIMVVAAVLLVGNTIRLSAFNRRRETGIMRLVGASNFYVQLPFLLEAVIAGLFGWIIAAGLLLVLKMLWLDTLQQYFTFNVQLSASDLVQVVILALCAGVLLCGATSFLTLRRYLRV